jgi:hypothetical protein
MPPVVTVNEFTSSLSNRVRSLPFLPQLFPTVAWEQLTMQQLKRGEALLPILSPSLLDCFHPDSHCSPRAEIPPSYPVYPPTAVPSTSAFRQRGGANCSGSRAYSIHIPGSCSTITVSPSTLPDGAVGADYNATITASGGTLPYTFAVTAGSLPRGLVMDPNSGVISGTPTTIGGFNFTITATDASGCAGAQAYSINISPVPCTYEDLFDDGVLDWTVVKPNVTETGGFLVLSPAGKKAITTSPAAFAGCAICTFTAEIFLDGGLGQKAWMLTHRIDKNNQIEILLDEAQDKIVVKQKVAGSVVVKVKANFTILPNNIYSAELNYDGTNITDD